MKRKYSEFNNEHKNGSNFGDPINNVQSNKKDVLRAVNKNGLALENMSEYFKNDKEVVLEAIKQNPYALKFASDACKDDREIVSLAVESKGRALGFASPRLKDDKELVIMAINSDSRAYQYVSKRLKEDKEVTRLTLRDDSKFLRIVPVILKKDKEVVFEAVKKEPWVYCYMHNTLKNDINFLAYLYKMECFSRSTAERNNFLHLDKVIAASNQVNIMREEAVKCGVMKEIQLNLFKMSLFAKKPTLDTDSDQKIAGLNNLNFSFK